MTSSIYKEQDLSKNIKLKAISKLEDGLSLVLEIFNALNIDNLTDGELKYFAIYFFKNRIFNKFWSIYNIISLGTAI